MCSIDLEECEVWSEKERRARKQHECSSCGAPIKSGSIYLVHFSIFAGNITSENMCKPCVTVRRRFAEEHGQSFTPGSLFEILEECVSEWDADSWRWRVALNRLRKRAAKMTTEHQESKNA